MEDKGFYVIAEIPFSPFNNHLISRSHYVASDVTFPEAESAADRLAKEGLRDSEGYRNKVDIKITRNGKLVKIIKGGGGI